MHRHAHHRRRFSHNPNAPMRPGAGGSRNIPGPDRHSRRGRKHSKRQADPFQSFVAAFDGDMRFYAGLVAFVIFMFLIYVLGIIAESVLPALPPI